MGAELCIEEVVITPNPVQVLEKILIQVKLYAVYPEENLYPETVLYPSEKLFE